MEQHAAVTAALHSFQCEAAILESVGYSCRGGLSYTSGNASIEIPHGGPISFMFLYVYVPLLSLYK